MHGVHAWKSRNDPVAGAQELIEDFRKRRGRTGTDVTANHAAFAFEIVKRFDAGSLCYCRHQVVDDRVADPIEFCRIVAHAGVVHRLIERRALADRGNCRAVLRGDVVEPIGSLAAARAGHVLRHDGGVAGDVLAEVACQQTGVDVVTTSDLPADHQLDALAGKETAGVTGDCLGTDLCADLGVGLSKRRRGTTKLPNSATNPRMAAPRPLISMSSRFLFHGGISLLHFLPSARTTSHKIAQNIRLTVL